MSVRGDRATWGGPSGASGDDAVDVRVVGGKAAQLERLRRLGFPVPASVVVPASWMEDALARAGLADAARDVLVRRDPSEAARLRVQVCSLPVDLASLQRWCNGQDGTFAVRSSGVAEDGARRSHAGVFASVLGVPAGGVADAVRQVWASRFSERAVLAAEPGDPVGMAVLVQGMVAPVCSGVMFTVDPRSGSWRQMVVEAVWGLAEPLVSGRMEPHAWVVSRPAWLPSRGVRLFGRVALTVAERSLPALRERAMLGPDGVVMAPIPEDRRGLPALTAPEVLALCRLGLRVEAALGGPQDIEWARTTDGRFVLLQSRPVTSGARPRGGTLWTRRFFGERFPDPVSPMSWSIVEPAILHLIAFPDTTGRLLGGEPALRLVRGRPYVNTTAFRHLIFKLPGTAPPAFMLELLPPDEARRWRTRFAGLPDFAVYASFFAETARERRWERFAWSPLDNPRAWRELVRRLEPWLASPLPADPLSAIADVEVGQRALRDYLGVHVPSLLFANLAWQLLDGLLSAHAPDRRAAWMEALAVSPPGNRTIALHRELAALAETLGPAGAARLRSGEPLSPTAASAVERLLARHGHRARVGWELFSPRLRDDPAQLVAWLPVLDGSDPDRRLADALAEVTDALPPAAAWAARLWTWLLRRYLLLRENQRWTFERLMARVQDAVLIAAAPLGLPPDDVPLLTWEELRRHVQAGLPADPALLEARRRARVEDAAAPAPVFLADDAPPPRALRLYGRPLSPGRAEGPIVRLRPGQTSVPAGSVVLVAALDPAATPVLGHAAAVLCELGGMLSHAAVLAREYHTPMVGNLEGDTSVLVDGAVVVVDGSRGMVWVRP